MSHARLWLIALGVGLSASLSLADYAADAHTVALWKFNRWAGLSIPGDAADSLKLTAGKTFPLEASPEDSAIVLDGSGYFTVASNPRLSIGRTGQITYQARLYLDQYPATTLHNQFSFVMGTYEGMGLYIRADGRISVGTQKGDGSSWMWYAPVTAKDVVPLKKWVEVAAACDQAASECYAYLDGTPVATYTYMVGESYQPLYPYAGPLFRSAPSVFTVGNSAVNNQSLKGKIEAIRVSDTLVLGSGPRSITTQDTVKTHFALQKSTVALWTFDSYYNADGAMPNFAGGSHMLASNSPPLETSPFGKAARCDGMASAFNTGNSRALTVGGTGRITLEARIYMDEYPSAALHNHAAVVAGMYEGLKLLIFADGRIQAGGQRRDGSLNAWYAPISRPRAVPLKKWVDVAVAADEISKQMYAYVDGVPVQLHVPDPVSSYVIDGFRSPLSSFFVSRDGVDGQWFKGLIDEVRVSDTLALGKGLDVVSDPHIMEDTVTDPPIPVKVKVNLGMKTHYAKPGDSVWVPIYLTNFDKVTLSAAQFNLNFDTAVVSLLSVSADSGLAHNWTLIDWNRQAKSPIAIAMGGADQPIGYGEGELLRLKLLVHPGAPSGAASRLELTGIKLDENAVITATHTPGRIVVAKPRILYGDVTGNGQVDIFDAVRIQEFVVGRITLPDSDFPNFTREVADVSGNGEVTSYDAALVFQYSLGMIASFPVEKPAAGKMAVGRAEAAFTVMGPIHVEGGVYAYRIRGENLQGLVGGELGISVGGSVANILKVKTSLPSARLAYRFDGIGRRLSVSLTANDPVAASGVDFIEIEVNQTAGMANSGLTLTSAYLNEGGIAGVGFVSRPLAIASVDYRLKAGNGRLVFRGRDLLIEMVPGGAAKVEAFDGRGRNVLTRTYAVAPAYLTLSRKDLPLGMTWIRVVHAGGAWTASVPNLNP